MPRQWRTIPLALLLLLVPALAAAQRPLSALLPDTTVLAFELTPAELEGAVLHGLFEGLDTTEAGRVLAELQELFTEVAGGVMEAPEDERDIGALKGMLAEECPALMDVLEEAAGQRVSAALGVSISRFDPEPDALLVMRPGTRLLSARLLAGAVACFDGRRYGEEGGSAIYLFADGSEMPLLVAELGGDLVAGTDPDLLRGAIRRAAGSGEPALADSRIAGYAQGLEPAGMKVTLNLAALAEAAGLFRGALPAEVAPLYERFVTTLQIVNGYAWSVSFGADGLTLRSVAAWDEALAHASGEEELLAVLSCAGCNVGDPPIQLTGAVGVTAGAYPLEASVAWLDSWLQDASEAGLFGGEALTVEGAFEEFLGLDLSAALLDWLEGSWYTTTLGVLDTDLSNWVMGLPNLTIAPVTSEEAAWSGVQLWLEAARDSDALADAMFGSEGVEGAMRFSEAVSVRELERGGVDYLRVRSGPNVDLGIAVFDGHLVVGSPVASLYAAIDARDQAGRLPEGLAGALDGAARSPGTLVGYSVTDTSSYLQGLGRIAELASGSVATTLWLAGVGMVTDELGLPPRGNAPTFDEILTLTDVAVDALELLAERTGEAVGVTTVEDGARWGTWRLPLGEND